MKQKTGTGQHPEFDYLFLLYSLLFRYILWDVFCLNSLYLYYIFICRNERLSTLVFRDLECETRNMSIY
jgi:hypothetical protein